MTLPLKIFVTAPWLQFLRNQYEAVISDKSIGAYKTYISECCFRSSKVCSICDLEGIGSHFGPPHTFTEQGAAGSSGAGGIMALRQEAPPGRGLMKPSVHKILHYFSTS